MADEIRLEPEVRDAIVFGPSPRPRDKALEDEALNAGQPTDRPVAGEQVIQAINTSQLLFPGRNSRRKFFIQNPSTNAVSIFVRTDGADASAAAGQSIEIPSGGFLSDDKPLSLAAFTVFATAFPLSFYAEELL